MIKYTDVDLVSALFVRANQDEVLSFVYTNYKNVTENRLVIPKRIYWGSTKFHPTPQFFMEAWDVERGQVRHFTVKDINIETLVRKPANGSA